MNTDQLIIDLLKQPARTLTPEEADVLRRAAADNPAACALPAALLLSHCGESLDSDERHELRQMVATHGTDRMALYEVAGVAGDDLEALLREAHGEPRQQQVSTESAINTFLETYGKTSPDDDALLERLIFNPVPEYAEILADTEPTIPAPHDSTTAAIDHFLAHSEQPQSAPAPQPEPQQMVHEAASAAADEPHPAVEVVSEPQDEADNSGGMLSESLARIFIKQGRYERAYEIISDLNLNYPKKSVYFADQLRFLQKLILIRQRSQGAATN